MTTPFPRALTLLPARRGTQDPALADALGDAAGIEVFEQRNRVFARDAQQVLDIGRADLLAIAEQIDEPRLDGFEAAGVKVERLLHADEAAGLDQDLEEHVLVVTRHAGAP